MLTVQLEKTKWLRGDEAAREPYLVHPVTLKYDTLGRIIMLGGVSVDKLKGLRFPSDYHRKFLVARHQLFRPPAQWLTNYAKEDTDATIEVIKLNDNAQMEDVERLQKINVIVSEFGITCELVDELPSFDELRYKQYGPYVLYDRTAGKYLFALDKTVIASRSWFDYNYGSPLDYNQENLAYIAKKYSVYIQRGGE
jgi:hypothetical protein